MLKKVLVSLVVVFLTAGITSAKDIELKKSGSTLPVSIQGANATCKYLAAEPRGVRSPKGADVWGEIKLGEVVYKFAAVPGKEESTRDLYVDTDRDGNLKEETPVGSKGSKSTSMTRYNFDLEPLTAAFKAGRNLLKIDVKLRLMHYDYGNKRSSFFVYCYDRYEGELEAFDRKWSVSWVPGKEPEMHSPDGSASASCVLVGDKMLRLSMEDMDVNRDSVELDYKLQLDRRLAPITVPESLASLAATESSGERTSYLCFPEGSSVYLMPARYYNVSEILEKKKDDETWRAVIRISSLTVPDKGTKFGDAEPFTVGLTTRLTNASVTFTPKFTDAFQNTLTIQNLDRPMTPPVVIVSDETGAEIARLDIRISNNYAYPATWNFPGEHLDKKITAVVEVEEGPFKLVSRTVSVDLATGSASGEEGAAAADEAGKKVIPLKEIEKKVNEAIKKGLEYLLKQQNPDGTFKGNYARSYPLGYNALGALTLVKCGASLKHPSVRNAYRNLSGQPLKKTYSVGLYLMALEAKYYNKKNIEKYKEKKKKKRSDLSTTTERGGGLAGFKPKIARRDRAMAQKLVNWLVKAQASNGSWDYYAKPSQYTPQGATQKTDRTDNSNMQYAILGLKAGSRLGAKVPASAVLKNLQYIIGDQSEPGAKVKPFVIPAAHLDSFEFKKNGDKKSDLSTGTDPSYGAESRDNYVARGWGYTPGYTARTGGTQSMTTAGLTAAIICKSELLGSKYFKGELVKKTNLAIEDGCAWLAANMKLAPQPGHWFYFMYGLERAGSLAGVRYFGTRDWYYEGVNVLLPLQNEDGSFSYTRQNQGRAPNAPGKGQQPRTVSNICDTCFTLLFLKRATVRVIENLDEEQIWTGGDILKGSKKKKNEEKEEQEDRETSPDEEEKEGEPSPEKKDKPEPAPAGR